jgi:catechol 2,3-dioxygenase-like lactoylglutathione lyase family enzyme
MKSIPTPRLYRVLVPAKDLDQSRRFYETLFSSAGRPVGGGRVYFDCGPVILGVLDYSTKSGAEFPSPAEALYFATTDLEGVHDRARDLGCLTRGFLHDDPSSPLGEIVVRPWGERSFYADDPSGIPLCFVDAPTVFSGTARQLAAFARRMNRGSPARASPARGPSSPRKQPRAARTAGRAH